GRPADAANVLHKLAKCVRQRGDRQAAEGFLRQALAIHRRAADRGESTAAVLSDLGTLVLRNGHSTSAEPLLAEALDLWRNVPGYELRPDPDVGLLARDLADVLGARGDRAAAG